MPHSTNQSLGVTAAGQYYVCADREKCIFELQDFSLSLIFFCLKGRAKEARNALVRALSIGKGFVKLPGTKTCIHSAGLGVAGNTL